MCRLLILDINGILCYKTSKNTEVGRELNFIELNSYRVVMRPGLPEFLKFCYDNFMVAFFSSTHYVNANAILEHILTPDQRKATIFFWFRDHTHFDPDYGKDASIKDHDTIKRLDDVLECPTINWNRRYNSSNTILCDDSEKKTRFNDNKNIIIFESFTGDERDTFLNNVTDELIQRFDEIA